MLTASILLRVFAGGLPGPVLFGFVIEHSCLLWDRKCDGSRGACLYYNNHGMAWLLLAVCVGCQLVNILSGLLGWRMHIVGTRRKADLPQTALEHSAPSVDQTGSDDIDNSRESMENISALTTERSEQSFSNDNPARQTETTHL